MKSTIKRYIPKITFLRARAPLKKIRDFKGKIRDF